MQIVVLKESFPDERRVALTPESVKKLITAGNTVSVESAAGTESGASDDDFRQAGAEVSGNREELLKKADILPAINRPDDNTLSNLKSGTTIISLLRPLDEPEKLQSFINNNLTAISLEMIPRMSRAQAMDGRL